MATEDYNVELEVFEGPLDLLLYLIKKDEVEIYDIPIETVTTQYMEYLGLMRMLDLNIAGEFIVMAATLMMIKSRMLLPVEERQEGDEEEDDDDPRWELVRQLVEYKKFKDAASRLQEMELHQENVFGIGGRAIVMEADDPGVVLQDVSLFDLIAAFNEVLKNIGSDDIGVIEADHVTVAEKIDHLINQLKQNRAITFAALFNNMASRAEIICTFLALLELARLRQVSVIQESSFDEIMISAADGDDQ